jgi:ABC-type transport system involved in cytochrome bd biosynthesis fused ATPase/permease subunit
MSFLLKFLLIALAVIWLLRAVARLIFPWAVKKAAEKMMNDAQQQFQGSPFQQQYKQQSSQRSQTTADGKVRIDYVPQKEAERKGADTVGEFVDFEEIK